MTSQTPGVGERFITVPPATWTKAGKWYLYFDGNENAAVLHDERKGTITFLTEGMWSITNKPPFQEAP